MNSLLRAFPVWAKRLLGALIAIQVLLSVIYASRRYLPGRSERLFDLDLEANITTWWSATLLSLVGLAALLVAFSEARGSGASWAWVLTGLGFIGLSLEEVAQIHEEVGAAFESSNEGRFWPILYSPLLILGAWAIWRCLRSIHADLRWVGYVGIAVLFAGIGAELASSSTDIRGRLQVMLEENTEYLGAGLLLVLFLTVASRRWELTRRPDEQGR